jgi:hypothetical protein
MYSSLVKFQVKVYKLPSIYQNMFWNYPVVAGMSAGVAILIAIISLWDLVWKGIGMWHAGRNNQLPWFIVILLFNTAGILPLVYLIWFQKNKSDKKSNNRKR